MNDSGRTYDLYIGHVPKSVQEAALLEVFSKYGAIADVLIRHTSGNYGFAIVKFKRKKDADKVLRQVDKICVDSHEMEVKNGKRHGVENCNDATSLVKTVTFAEPLPSIHLFGNMHMMEVPMSVTDFKYAAYPTNENASVPITIEIMCTNVENAVSFHGCSITNFEELQDLSIKLNSICPNLSCLLRKPVVNKVYGAVYSGDYQWYRCRVLQCGASSNSSTCFVEYIDYGNIAEVCYTNMVELPEPLKNLGPFAIKCVFSNLIPTSKSLNCVSYLHHLVNHRMSLCAIHTWGTPEYLVTKCSCNGIDVIAELVRNGYAVYRTQESSKDVSPKRDKVSKPQENKKSKKVNGVYKNKKAADVCNGTSKQYLQDARSEGFPVHGKSNKSPLTVESRHSKDFIPKKIIKRGSDTSVDNHEILEVKSVNHLLKVDSVISNVKVINNIRSLIPLHTYDDLITEAMDLLKDEINVSSSNDSKKVVELARKMYCKTLADLKDCSEQELFLELKEKRNKQRIQLCNELEIFLKSFDCTLLEKRKKIQETITALESNSTAWLNVYLPKIPNTVESLLVAFNEEKEKKRNSIEMSRRNTDEKREKFLKVYADLGKEFSFNMVNGTTEDSHFVNNAGKKGSWAVKFDEALTEFGIALEEERKISTVIEDRSYVSVIQYILEKLDIPKDKIDTECEIYEEYKSLYEDLTLNSDLSPVFDELHTLEKIINAFAVHSDDKNVDKFSDQLLKLHSALIQEDALLVNIAKASAQHFPELVREHPELKLEEYQQYFCLLKFNWNLTFFPCLKNCNRIEPSFISKFRDEPVVVKEFCMNYDSENIFIKKVKAWNDIKSNTLVKVKGLFKNKPHSSDNHNAIVNGEINHEIHKETQTDVIIDNNNVVANITAEQEDSVETNCLWIDCEMELVTQDELIVHVNKDHIQKNNTPFVCRWKECSRKEKPFKALHMLVTHIRKHTGEKSHKYITRNIIYAVLPPVWETLYDKPLPIPVDHEAALNILQQVLDGLCDIHSRGIVHGIVHPMSVLHNDGKVQLDLNFNKHHLKSKVSLKGINFQVPNEGDAFKSADMYGFGCLVLWVLFPNLSFHSTDKGVPNISAFQSIIQDMLFPRDYSSLSALLDANRDIRPSSRILRSNGFLKNLHIVSGASP